ncbi:condensin complex subunit 2-like [Halichondria panicea]|uniref:condensin complex subunit 2-like n=1 Tax=Halichondria panicea TaxID=6063 RepID=UPI00312BA2D6
MANNMNSEESTPVSLTAHKRGHLYHGTAPRTADLTKTPGGTVAKVTFNDDEAERRERRFYSNLATMISPGCHTPRSAVHSSAKRGNKSGVESVTSSLTNTQLKEHYANCVKLSAMNRINAKNAFGLHLIDHMMQLLTIQGEMTNFQMASSTLDASAKIYAGRVDSIYTDAYKVLTGFGRESQNEATEQTEQDGENNSESGKGKTKKTTSSGVNKVLEKNVKNLNINTFDLEYQVDPLFKKTSAAFDEGGVEGLLINHLHTEAGFTLSLDADEILNHNEHPTTTSVDLPSEDILKIINVDQVRSRQLCPTFTGLFSDNNEDGWSMEQATSSVGKSSSHQSTDIGAEYSMLPFPPSVPDLTVRDDDGMEPAGPMGDAELSPAEDIADLTVLGSDNKMAGFIPTTVPINSADIAGGEGPLGALVLAEAIQKSEYSYFSPSVLATWAGPKHWKIQPKTDNSDKDDNKRKKKRQAPAQFSIDFTETPDDSQFSKGKASVQLSKPVLARRNSSTTTLPENTGTKVEVLWKLFTRPKWEVKRRRGKTAQMEEDQLEGDWYDYENNHDSANFCPQVEEESDGDIDAGGMADFPLDSQDVDDPSQPLTDLMLAGDNLVPQPRKVQQIHIEYAKTAKRLDVKKLKGKMWELLSSAESVPSGEEQTDSGGGGGDRLSFSSMCSDLPSKLTAEMKRNISVPIAFVCLLHLANEKCLDIQGVGEDLSDLEIATPQQTVTS